MQDFDEFQRRLCSEEAIIRYFDGTGPVTCTRAPGRLDVMGGVADYSGSLVAEATIGEAAFAAVQHRDDDLLRFRSDSVAAHGHAAEVVVPLSQLYHENRLRTASELRAELTGEQTRRWAAYLAGCYHVLLQEKIIDAFARGANVFLESQVPIGAGVSSSAAIEVAMLQALNAQMGLGLDAAQVATLAQRVENEIVGAPCGIMDQMSAAAAGQGTLLLLLCRPHTILGHLRLTDAAGLYGIDSGVQHSVGGNPYGRARVSAFMGRRIVNYLRQENGYPPIEYLTQITPEAYRTDYAARIPVTITGRAFLDAYGETGDPVTRVDPETVYPVRAGTEHPVYEHDRVSRFVEDLRRAGSDEGRHAAHHLQQAGARMYASHWSYSRIGLGSAGTNMIVEIAREMGLARGICGAKITGGGSGGTVALLTYGDDGPESVQDVAREYAKRSGHAPRIMHGGISPGAMEFGHMAVTLPSTKRPI